MKLTPPTHLPASSASDLQLAEGRGTLFRRFFSMWGVLVSFLTFIFFMNMHATDVMSKKRR